MVVAIHLRHLTAIDDGTRALRISTCVPSLGGVSGDVAHDKFRHVCEFIAGPSTIVHVPNTSAI